MSLTASEKIRVILARRNMNITTLADRLSVKRSNLSTKITKNKFDEKELREIAEALDCDFDATFTLRDTGETL